MDRGVPDYSNLSGWGSAIPWPQRTTRSLAGDAFTSAWAPLRHLSSAVLRGDLFYVRQLPATVVSFHFSVVSNLKSAGNGKD
jgi:hypothetical protein